MTPTPTPPQRRQRGSWKRRIAFRKRSPDRLRPVDERLLAEVGDAPVTKLVLMRQPLKAFYTSFLKTLLRRKLADVLNDPYERLFHLSLWINDAYVLEKTQVVRFHALDTLDADVETFEVSLNGAGVTVRQLIERTLASVGAAQFAEYEAFARNCQHFVRDVLDANRFNTPEAAVFVVQDAASILAALPRWVRKRLGFVTGGAARFDHFRYGNAMPGADAMPEPMKRYQLLVAAIARFRAQQVEDG